MLTDLLVIVPSRGRPKSVPRLLDAWDATGGWSHASLVFAVDADDPKIDAYRRHATDRQGDGKHWWLRELPEWMPMVDKLDRVAADTSREYRAVGFFGDDHVPRSGAWSTRFLTELDALGTGIVYGDDGLQGERLPTHWVMTSDIVRALGCMVPAEVEHLYCDNVILDLGREADCLRFLADVVVEHMHPLAGRADWDDQYRRVNSAAQYGRDRAAYERWRAERLADNAATVRALREKVDAQ